MKLVHFILRTLPFWSAIVKAQESSGLRSGFLQDVVMLAEETGSIASDSNLDLDEVVVANSASVQLSDEEILANNPKLAKFFETIEDEDKYQKWKEEELPHVLLDIQASASKTSRRQKRWAKKALMKSEISGCWTQKYGKAMAYPICRRWGWRNVGLWGIPFWVPGCEQYGCDPGDINVAELCHHSCNGWNDDGTTCWKPCGQSTTPFQCGNAMCTSDVGQCVATAMTMAFSLVNMLASVFPYSKVTTLAGNMRKAANMSEKIVLLKTFVKDIAWRVIYKAKRKVRHFMKVQKQNFVEYLSDEAVDFILQEAAEAFAIERTRQSVGYDVPSFEEIARAIDPIGISEVVDAFNLNSCSDTEIEDWPPCSTEIYASFDLSRAISDAEEFCCGYTVDSFEFLWFGRAKCSTDGTHLPVSVSSAQDAEGDVDSLADDDHNEEFYDGVDPENILDVIWEELPMPAEDLMICRICFEHATCTDNQIPGANLTFFNVCTEKKCCGPTEDKEASRVVLNQDQDICLQCDGNGLCELAGAYEFCSKSGCCKGTKDPSAPGYVPPPIEFPNSTSLDNATVAPVPPDDDQN